MASLEDILNKNKSKTGKQPLNRSKLKVVNTYRPYDIENTTPNSDKISAPQKDKKSKVQTESKLGTNKVQTESKLGTNKVQTESKLGTNKVQTESKLGTNKVQTESKLGTNKVQTESKLGTNKVQTESKLGTNKVQTESKLGTNKVQTESKLGTNKVQTESKLGTNKVQTESKLGTNKVQTESKLGTNKVQTESKLGTSSAKLSTLSPLVINILTYIYSHIDDHQKRESSEIKIADLALDCDTSINTAKVTIKRLSAKYIIVRSNFKAGKFGWSQYKMSLDIFKQFQDLKTPQINNFSEKKIGPIYNSNTITTKNNIENQNQNLIVELTQQIEELKKQQSQLNQSQANELSNSNEKERAVVESVEESHSDAVDWTNLDYSALSEFGFKKSHVTQIKNFNKTLDVDMQLTVESVQESIEHYAWALANRLDEMTDKYGKRFQNNTLGILIGVLKKGGNWVEANYKSAADEAFEASLAAKKERLEKIKAQKEEMLTVEFELWRESLSDKEVKSIEKEGDFEHKLPPSAHKKKGDSKLYVNALRNHFINNVYER